VRALTAWPLEVTRLRLLAHGENTTFEVRARLAGVSGRLLCRVHRAGYQDSAGILSELAWLRALESAKIEAPRPVKARDGWVVSADHPNILGSRNVTLLHWVPGSFRDASLRPCHMARLGRYTARLQRHGRTWVRPDGFARTELNPEDFFGSGPDSLLELPGLKAEPRRVLERTVVRLVESFRQVGTGPDRFGLIHADLHHHNVLHRPDAVAAIDFDDVLLGWYAFDLAVTLSALRSHARLPELRRALVEAYALERGDGFPERVVLDDFILARGLSIMGWLGSRRDNPVLWQRYPGCRDRMIDLSRAYLDRSHRS
jgi:Ser/Thr protein kinase RdoA (MazF antagonist)